LPQQQQLRRKKMHLQERKGEMGNHSLEQSIVELTDFH
jgi:hypothetical protein